MLTCRWLKCLPSQLNGPSWVVSAFLIRSIASQYRSSLLTGLTLEDAISVPPDFTNPMSKRPFARISAVAYSSAIRTGSGRNDINVPRLSTRTFRVWRHRMLVTIGLAPISELMPA